jgi:hypothetical protein
MQRSYLLLIFLIGHFSAFSQVNESFSDANFTDTPQWQGETAYFIVNSALQLQSNGPNANGQLHLSVPNSRSRDTEWNFYTLLDFDITSSNWAKIYLTSDRADTEDNPKGYYIKFDGTNNSVDLYKQDSLTHTKIIAGKNGRAGKTTLNIFSIKVICDVRGNWYLFSDSTGSGNNFVKEGYALDSTFSTSQYSGVYFVHSSTRRMKFYFDDLVIKQAPLSLLSAKATSSSSVDVVFSKEVDQASANNSANYLFNASSLTVNSASLDAQNKNLVHLQLSGNLNTYTSYNISVENVYDLELNKIDFLNTASFLYRVQAAYGDLIITEIFPDPSPQNGLPEAEYIELFNRKSDTLNIQNFIFSDGSTNAVFPSYKIPPNQYLLVCSNNNKIQFSAWSPVLGLPVFPSLNNSGDKLTLKNQNGILLHEVDYTDLWYNDNDKKQGGWSLEMIDTNNPCGEESNWTASIEPSGGTPTGMNSVAASRPDLKAPHLVHAFINDSSHIELLFDEKPDAVFLSVGQFSLNKNLVIKNVLPSMVIPERIILEIFDVFKTGEKYDLTYSGIKDCNGNSSGHNSSIELVLPQRAGAGDLILNEVLFNPRSGGIDFVELYNNSEKYIDLKKWHFANIEENDVANKKIISNESFILKPNEYAAFTEDKSILFNQYPLGNQDQIFQIKDLPSYNDDIGTVILLDSNYKVMDRFDYNEEMHYALIDDKEGVSLERITFEGLTDNYQNWQSASTQSGYATPGYRNSQRIENTEGTSVWIEPKVITPDGNGDKDFALINYKFNSSGNTANITIFDQYGREMLKLAKNDLLASEGFYQWDGNNTQNEKVRTGVYIVYFELFNLKGEIKKFKETVVVGWKR